MSDKFNILLERLKAQLQALDRELFVVDENGTDGHAASLFTSSS